MVAVTGTKGKSTVVELINAVLEEAGFKTASASTINFKIGEKKDRNMFKMTMPGRFFLQKFLRKAVSAECDWVVVEMTSEGAKQFRHKFIDLDALVFTNLSPEHIESHGSYENYVQAKLGIARTLSRSKKERRVLVINNDDGEAEKFKAVPKTEKALFSLKDAENLKLEKEKTNFRWEGLEIESRLLGEFNIYNILSALTFAKAFGIDPEKNREAIRKLEKIRGRVEKIEGPGFEIFVDYAHTPDSLEKFYKAFKRQKTKMVCILGNTGGGRDKWKRPEMGRIANQYCDQVILTDEDPYDEDPEKILKEMAISVEKEKLEIILDRREAISTALTKASSALKKKETINNEQDEVVVLITGKGTDPYIMGPQNTKIPWDDASVVREELRKL